MAPAKLSLHHLTALDTSPAELIAIAGRLGCEHVCLFTYVPDAIAKLFPCVGEGDVAELAASLEQAGVTLCNLEVFPLDADPDWAGFERSLAVGRALGASRATVHIHDLDDRAGAAALARFCDMAAGFGIAAGLEFNGFSAVRTLSQAAAIVEAADRPGASLVCDMLHLVRNGGGPDDIAAARDRIGYLQICDGPRDRAREEAWHEAIRERGLPGTGDFPLAAALAALRPDTIIDVEVPQNAARKAGIPPFERARRAVEAARGLIANFMPHEAAR
nr:sugar phosphate isomerase/epimerase [Sphingomonas sp. Y57]